MSTLNDFHYAISLAQTLYDVEGDTDQLEEIGLIAYNFIGNKKLKIIYKKQKKIVKKRINQKNKS